METIVIDSVETYNTLYSQPATSHPLISVIDLRNNENVPNHLRLKFGLYGLFLKNVPYCTMTYGRRKYDFQSGTVVSIAPGQTVEINLPVDEKYPDVVGLIFHPDLIYRTPLANKIHEFEFFNYSELESLHISEKEKEKFNFYLNLIKEEKEHPIDIHSASVLSANIQLLLEHLDRFYDRQFITRRKENSDVVKQFNRDLKSYYINNHELVFPSVTYFAEKASLTSGYFSSLIKKETGMTPKDAIALYVVSEAKRRLLQSSEDIAAIAYSLGFDYPAHFTRMFKRIVGHTPKDFRELNLQN